MALVDRTTRLNTRAPGLEEVQGLSRLYRYMREGR